MKILSTAPPVAGELVKLAHRLTFAGLIMLASRADQLLEQRPGLGLTEGALRDELVRLALEKNSLLCVALA